MFYFSKKQRRSSFLFSLRSECHPKFTSFLSLSVYEGVHHKEKSDNNNNNNSWGEFILGERLRFNDHLECVFSPELMLLRRREKLFVPETQQLHLQWRNDRKVSGVLRRDYYAMTQDSCEGGAQGRSSTRSEKLEWLESRHQSVAWNSENNFKVRLGTKARVEKCSKISMVLTYLVKKEKKILTCWKQNSKK